MGNPGRPSRQQENPRDSRTATVHDQGLSRRQRLTKSPLFKETYAQGRRWIGRYMVLWLREGEGASLRLGVVAGRKVGNAVARARAKRRLREAYRRNRDRFAGPFDVVIVARKSMGGAKWDDIVAELLYLARRAGLVEGGESQI
ncbi:MAG: ribonuclease P protein component [Kiritimatiellae bacterium]|nr:ribonuclease P protein component [Kiritimatiellia bacterium]